MVDFVIVDKLEVADELRRVQGEAWVRYEAALTAANDFDLKYSIPRPCHMCGRRTGCGH